MMVSARQLPRWHVPDACDDVWIVDEVLKEALPFLCRYPGSPKHVAKFADAVVREGSLVGFLVDLDTDDIAVGEVVVVADNGFEEVEIFPKQVSDVAEHADGGGRRHQAASLLG